MERCDFIVWLATTGLATAAGVALSYLVEWFPEWDALAPRVKRLLFGALCAVIGFGAWGFSYVLCPAPVDWWAVLVAWWAAFSAFGGGTLAHTRKL